MIRALFVPVCAQKRARVDVCVWDHLWGWVHMATHLGTGCCRETAGEAEATGGGAVIEPGRGSVGPRQRDGALACWRYACWRLLVVFRFSSVRDICGISLLMSCDENTC